MLRNGNCVMICGFFKGNEVSPESNISIDTRHIVQQICVA